MLQRKVRTMLQAAIGRQENTAMKSRIVWLAVVMVGLMHSPLLASRLPSWLDPNTEVLTAGPQSAPMSVSAMWLDNNSDTVVVEGDKVTFGAGSWTESMWDLTWTSIVLDRDPFVSFVGGFTNTTGSSQDFVFGITTPISPALTSTLYGGSTIVTFGDGNNDGLGGLANDTSVNPAYSGTIDGTGVLSMLTSLSLTPTFAGDASQFATETQGLPGPNIGGPAANSSIGILHRFNLSAGDQGTFNSTFHVVPEPAVVSLLLSGAVCGLLLWRRRRKVNG
ncbi:MAG: PEP-CTERM sorting domain-containing protein [candidate division Zixibacteria bacterium]|nr:PEP-CTERM sorting domain-containing protein [candidate division Zixibacteria bacterium]